MRPMAEWREPVPSKGSRGPAGLCPSSDKKEVERSNIQTSVQFEEVDGCVCRKKPLLGDSHIRKNPPTLYRDMQQICLPQQCETPRSDHVQTLWFYKRDNVSMETQQNGSNREEKGDPVNRSRSPRLLRESYESAFYKICELKREPE